MPNWKPRWRLPPLKLKLLVEPGGAAALAALLAGSIDARGKAVALLLSGGNADFAVNAAIAAV